MSKIKFILVVPFAEHIKISNKIEHKTINYDILEDYKITAGTKKPIANTSLYSSYVAEPRFPPNNRAVDKAYRLLNANGLVDLYKLKRYRSSNSTISAKEFKLRLNIKGGAIMYTGTAKDSDAIDLIKTTLLMQKLECIKIYSIESATTVDVTEI